jgi:RND family efflux transporter MFP subunit
MQSPAFLAALGRRIALLLPLLACPAIAWTQQAPPLPRPTSSGLLACLILPDRVADLGSPVIGVVESVEVERGAVVKKGQVLARLRADVERANTSVARSRAEGEADLRGAQANRDLAQQKLERARSLAAQNFVSGQAVEQAEAEYRVAKERMLQSREQLDTSAREVSSAQAQVSLRILRSPFDGVVTERYVNPGERVEEKPLLKVAVVNQLKVEVVASTTLFGSLQLGQELEVQPELSGAALRSAKVSQIDRVLEPASNTFRLRLDLPNEDGALPAGLRCKVSFAKPAPLPKAGVASGLELTPVATGPVRTIAPLAMR